MTDQTRPPIAKLQTGAKLREWYWLKSELVDHARELKLNTTGGKFEILDRIAHFLDTGERLRPARKRVTSKFDWHSEVLTPDTIITDSYKNTQNVRRFFKSQIGEGFKFSINTMEWMTANTGKTLADAVSAIKEMQATGAKAAIKPHNQFNQYTRDFLADNPNLGMEDVRRTWALKRALPSADGRHVYARTDLDLEP